MAVDPRNAQAPFVLGTIHANRGNWVAAESAFRLATRVSPGFLRAHLSLANVLASQNRVEEAMQVAEQAAKADSNSGEAFAYLGSLKFVTGQVEGCKRLSTGGAASAARFLQLLQSGNSL